MAVENMKQVVIDNIFSKGYLNPTGEYTMLTSFSPFLRNVRIDNQNTTIRPGYRTIATDTIYTKIRGLTGNASLYCAVDGKLKSIDTSTGVYTTIGNLAGDYDYNFVNSGKYTICMDEENYPYLYDGTTLSQLTSQVYGRYADLFLNGVYMAGGKTNKATLYASRGITADNPEYCYDFTSTYAEKIYAKSNIMGLASSINRLFVFTEKHGIRYISPETTMSVGGLTATTMSPISGSTGNIPASFRSVVKADDIVFFFTKNKQVKCLNYIQGITEPQVGNISERASQSIDDFMDTIDDDQSASFGYFNHNSRTVHWHLKKKGSLFNDVVLVYDVINDTFLIDDNKNFSCVAYYQDTYFTGSAINATVYQDEYGLDDDGLPIKWYRYTKNMSLGNQVIRKTFREIGIVGQLSSNAIINVEVIVDGKNKYSGQILGSGLSVSGYGSVPQGSTPTGLEANPQSLSMFNKLISKGNLRAKGNVLQVRFWGESLGDKVVLSTMTVGAVVNNTVELSNKI